MSSWIEGSVIQKGETMAAPQWSRDHNSGTKCSSLKARTENLCSVRKYSREKRRQEGDNFCDRIVAKFVAIRMATTREKNHTSSGSGHSKALVAQKPKLVPKLAAGRN